jgi:hypothetical protein
METRVYRIVRENPEYHSKPWCVEVRCSGFWQQVSPWYMYCSAATRYCQQKQITIQGIVYLK